MDVIIALVVSFFEHECHGVDFCTLFAFIDIALRLHDYTNDKTAKR